MKRIYLLMLFLLTACPPVSLAVTVTNLYQAEVPVADQSAAARATAIRAALVQVMIKLTGNRNAAGIYGVDELQARADQLLQQYEYRSAGEEGNSRLHLWVRFDPRGIDNGMREYNIPVWSQERPSTLIWLVIRDDLGQRFASLDANSRYFTALQEQASARGIPFITPLYDLQDAAAIRTDDVIGGFEEPLIQASERYQPDAILAGTVMATASGLWEARWLAIIQGQPRQWISAGDSIEMVLGEGMEGLADQLAAAYAQQQGFASENTGEISITGVDSFARYARALSYLESLNLVSSVNVKSLDSKRVTCVVSARGDMDTLHQALVLGRVLQPAGNPGEYRLLP